MAYALLVLAQVAGLILVPLGLPGLWLQVLALAGYAWATGFERVGWLAILAAAALAAVAEAVEFVLGGRFAARFGGSRRAVWGALIGGVIGAIVGVPILIIGSVIGAFIGSFVGAVVMELSLTQDWRSPEWRGAVRVGWGALLGRIVAVGVKGLFGVAIGILALLAAV